MMWHPCGTISVPIKLSKRTPISDMNSDGIESDESESHQKKQLFPILLTDDGMDKVERDDDPQKQSFSMILADGGMDIDDKDVHTTKQ